MFLDLAGPDGGGVRGADAGDRLDLAPWADRHSRGVRCRWAGGARMVAEPARGWGERAKDIGKLCVTDQGEAGSESVRVPLV